MPTWDKCIQYEKNELEKIQNEAATIDMGSTKDVSIRELYKEINWDTLDERHRKQKLALFYKMVNGLSPPYLSSLLPLPVNRVSSITCTTLMTFKIPARTNLYYNSFLPSAI